MIIETEIPGIDVDALMQRVREEMDRRSRRSSYLVTEELLSYSQQLVRKPKPELIPIKAAYTVQELVSFKRNEDFVANAYRALLQREPDAGGFASFLAKLDRGELTRIELLGNIHYSKEGRSKAVSVRGLFFPYLVRKIFRLPGIGYLLRVVSCIYRLPVLFRNVTHMSNSLKRIFDLLEEKLDNEKYIGGLRKISLAFNELEENARSEFEKVDRRLETVLRQLVERHQADFDDYLQQLEQRNRDLEEKIEQRMGEMLKETDQLLAGRKEELLQEFNSRLSNLLTVQRSLLRLERQIASAKISPQTPPAGAATCQEEVSYANLPLETLYLSLEDRFRGEREDIKKRFQVYLPYVREVLETIPGGRVLDLGCGRGEWLELLQEQDIAATGIDMNETIIRDCTSRGLDVVRQDLFEYLRKVDNSSIAVVTGFHVVEHLPFDRLVLLLDEALRVVKDTGLLIFETPNPENLLTGACNFYMDPTHKNPLPPLLLEFLFKARGVKDVRILRLHPNESVCLDNEVVQNLLFGPQDYAVLGWK